MVVSRVVAGKTGLAAKATKRGGSTSDSVGGGGRGDGGGDGKLGGSGRTVSRDISNSPWWSGLRAFALGVGADWPQKASVSGASDCLIVAKVHLGCNGWN